MYRAMEIGFAAAVCGQFYIGVPENIVLLIHHRALSSKKQQRILVVQPPHLVWGQQFPPGLLIVGRIAPAAPFCLAVGAGFNGFLAQQLRHIFVRCLLYTSPAH